MQYLDDYADDADDGPASWAWVENSTMFDVWVEVPGIVTSFASNRSARCPRSRVRIRPS